MIYLDHAASTPCDPRVVEAMQPYFTEVFGNPACGHAVGRAALDAVETARRQAADLIHSRPEEIVFTAGASESNNLAIKGAARAIRGRDGDRGPGHVVTSAIEHKAVLQPCRQLEEEGFEVTYLIPPHPDGLITPALVEGAMRADTILVSLMGVNNEIGTVSDLSGIGALCRDRGILFHTDATQMIGLLPIDVERAHIDLLSWSGHKICGPKGAGGLYVREGVELVPIIAGGGHERGRRAGTLNVPGIVGLGRACELCAEEMDDEATRVRAWRARLEDGLRERLGEVIVNGHAERRAPHIANLCFPGAAGTRVVERLDGVACSSGAAVGGAVSHVLTALGVSQALAMTSLRMSLGRSTTPAIIDAAIERVVTAIEAGRQTPVS